MTNPRPASDIPLIHEHRRGAREDVVEQAVLDHLNYTCGVERRTASLYHLYAAMAHATRDRLLGRWLATRTAYHRTDPKRVYYLSAEYLLGRALAQNLDSLGLYRAAEKLFRDEGLELTDILEEEPDPGLGNGGLGRLAACFLDSMATLGLPSMGYGIRYEYGIFEQGIENGEQVEHGDAWLRRGHPWEIPRYEYSVPVRFYGEVEEHHDGNGTTRRWVGGKHIVGMPYDLPVAGHRNGTVNTLRLWSARASRDFDLHLFNAGDFRRAVEEKVTSETISRVLYPADHSIEGKELRLKQQYFFVACSIHDLVRRYRRTHATFDAFADKVAIQLNDTHPAVAVAELMRVLVDDFDLPWDQAWTITTKTFAYTNHTLMPEALEKWPVEMFGRILPRHLEIIYEINAGLLRRAHIQWPGDLERRRRVSIIEEENGRSVRMAHLAAAGSHRINGVAAIHSELVKERLLPDFAEMWPDRFINETNGVSPRRWMKIANRPLAKLLEQRIGSDWLENLPRLQELEKLADDTGFHDELRKVKSANKKRLANLVADRTGVRIDPTSVFQVQVKRIHEYKRQILACMHIVSLYLCLRDDPTLDIVPQTFIFAGKAAPGYAIAKQHIRLITDIASIINNDPIVNDRLRVVFVPNYSVSVAERIIPAADVSLQISLAGTEASGTGNMKLSMNGALTVGTLDGANIEIRENVGEEAFFLFGMDVPAAIRRRETGYSPQQVVVHSPMLSRVVDAFDRGLFSPDDPDRGAAIANYLVRSDPFMACADFDEYVACQARVEETYRDAPRWMRHVVHNIARMHGFSSDETIRHYARDVWNVHNVPVEVES